MVGYSDDNESRAAHKVCFENAFDVMKDALDAERERVALLHEVLEMVEWSGEYPYDPCFWCNANRKDGHAPDCKRQEALEGNE